MQVYHQQSIKTEQHKIYALQTDSYLMQEIEWRKNIACQTETYTLSVSKTREKQNKASVSILKHLTVQTY